MNKKIIFAATLLAVLVASMVTIPLAYADSTGAKSGTSFANITFTGSDDNWASTSNAAASDNSRATVTITSSSNISAYLRATGFGFSVPNGATINGITVGIERSEGSASPSSIRDNVVSLVKNNVVVGTNKAATSTNWPTTDAVATYGGATDLWGTTWSVSDINNANFGVVLSVGRTSGGDEQARVDQITITVNYTPNTPPTANNQNLNTNEDTSLSITLTGIANDAGQTLTFEIVTNPSSGSLTGFNANTGAVTYNPNANSNSADSFTFRVNDGFANSTSATVSITVNPVNDAPVATGQNVNTDEDTPLPITLAATDVDGNTLTWTITDNVDNGIISGTAPNLTYTPSANYHGPDSLQFRVNDGTVNSNTATVSITVNSVNDAPVLDTIASPQTVSELATLTFNASATDPDVSDTLTFSLSGGPPGASISQSGAFSWTPSEGQAPGSYTFDVLVSDGLLSDSQSITVNVNEANEQPVLNAIGDQTVSEGDSVSILTGAIDNDLPANNLTFSAEGLPTWASINSATGELTGTPGEADDGMSEVTVIVEDGQGGTDSETFNITVTEVNTAPELAAIGSQDVNELSTLSFTATATDADLPANTLTFSLSGAVPSGASITPTGAFSFTPDESQGPASYTFDVLVSDGSASDSETITVTVNEVNAAPDLAAIGNQTVNELATLSFTAAATDIDEPANPITFSLSGEPAGAAISSTGDFSWTPTESQGPGVYTFAVIVSDGEATDSETISVTVGEVNASPVLGVIGNQNVDEGSLLAFTATATDGDEPENVLAFSLSGAPEGASMTSDGQFMWTPTESQGPGSYTFDVIISDGAQTDSETITVTVAEVNQNPVLNTIGNQTTAENSPFFVATGAADADEPANTLTYSAEGLPTWASIDTATGEITGTPGESDDGIAVVTVTVEDANGGSDSETFSLTVTEVNTAPVLGSVGNQAASEESLLAFTATATDLDLPANTLSFSLVNEPAGASITSTGDFSWTPTEAQGPGEYTFDVVVSDGFETDTETITVTIDEVNTAPQLDSIGDQSVDELSTLSFTATAADADLPANTLTFSLSGEPAGAAITPTGEFTFTPTEDQGPGNYTFDVIVSDGATTDIETITVTVSEVNTDPTLNAIGDQTVGEGDSVSIPTGATDADLPANSLTYEATGLPTWASINAVTGEITGTPTESDQGISSVTVSVQDGQGGSDSETFSLAVAEVNSAPALDAIGNQTIDELATLSFTATATDADIPADTLTFSLTGEPSGAAITPDGSFSWTPTEGQGPSVYTFDVVVSDGTVTDSETISVTVNEVNSDPQLTNPGTQTFNEGSTISIPMTATDGDEPANTLTFAASGLPSWASIDTATGEITGTPSEGDDGTVAVEVTVQDGQGGSHSETFDLTIEEVNSAPTLDAIGPQSIDEGSMLQLAATATDSDLPANTLAFSLLNEPAGASITSDGQFTWTPTEAQGPGEYTFDVIVSDGSDTDSETITVSVNEANEPPVIGEIETVAVDELSVLSFTVNATDADLPANTLTFSLSGEPAGAAISPTGELTIAPDETQGPNTYTFDIVVSDGLATDTESITVVVYEVNSDPVLNTIGDQLFQEGSAVSLPTGASDNDVPTNTLTFGATGLPVWASIDALTGEITGTPGESDDGVSSVTVTVEDGQGGSDSETFNLTVTEENAIPVLETIGELNVEEGSLLAFTVNATDADAPGQTLTFGLTDAPDGAAISLEGAFTWTPAEDQGPGNYAFNVTVSDSLASDFETIVVTVNEINADPELGSIGHKFIDELSPLSFTATAVDADLPANILSYSLSGPVPSGASITPEGLFAWTPTEAQGPGEYTFDVVVSDGSATDTESVTITVAEVHNTDNTRPNVAIVSPPSGDNASGPASPLTLNVQGTASDGESGVAEVMVRTNSASYQMATPASPGNWTTWSSNVSFLTSGNHQVVARATDNAGNIRWFIVNVNVDFETDTTKPMVTITSPTNGDTLSGPSSGVNALIQGTAFDGQSGVQQVEIRTQNSAYQPATPVSPGDWSSWSFGKVFATAGSYQIVAKVTDNAGNMQWHIINIQIDGPDSTRPSLTVTSPVDGQTISGPSSGVTVHLEGTASDLSGVQIVESRTESTIYQPASPTSPGDWSAWSRDVTFTTAGPHQLVVRATDSAGNMQWVVVNVNIEFTS